MLRRHAEPGRHRLGARLRGHAGAEERQQIGDPRVHARIALGDRAQGRHVAGLADEGGFSGGFQDVLKPRQRRRRRVARARGGEDLSRGHAQDGLVGDGNRAGGGGLNHAVDRARFQKMDQKRRDPASRRGLAAQGGIGRMSRAAFEHRPPIGMARPVLFQNQAGTGRGDGDFLGGVERRGLTRTQPAGLLHDHLDPSGRSPAQPPQPAQRSPRATRARADEGDMPSFVSLFISGVIWNL